MQNLESEAGPGAISTPNSLAESELRSAAMPIALAALIASIIVVGIASSTLQGLASKWLSIGLLAITPVALPFLAVCWYRNLLNRSTFLRRQGFLAGCLAGYLTFFSYAFLCSLALSGGSRSGFLTAFFVLGIAGFFVCFWIPILFGGIAGSLGQARLSKSKA